MVTTFTTTILAVVLQGGGNPPSPPISLPARPGSYFAGESGVDEVCTSNLRTISYSSGGPKGYHYYGYLDYSFTWSISVAGSITIGGPQKWDNIYWWLVCQDENPFEVGYHLYPTLSGSGSTNLVAQVINARSCTEGSPD